MGDATTALAGARRPRRARGDPRPGLPGRDASTTSTRRPCGARSAAGPSTTSRAAPASSGSWRSRATSTAPGGRLELTAEGGAPDRARPRCAGSSPTCARAGRGDHDVHDAGAAGELTGASRPWQFGDEQPLDVVRTLTNAVRAAGRDRAVARIALVGRGLRGRRDRAAHAGRGLPAGRPVVLDGAARHLGRGEDDRAGAARPGHRAVSRRTRCRSSASPATPGVSQPTELAGPWTPDYVQGTNLQHALMLAGRFLDQHPDAEPIVLVVTDGEPTAHLTAATAGRDFDWPPRAGDARRSPWPRSTG